MSHHAALVSALASLLPSARQYTPPPAPLLSLATSLLSTSHTLAPHLKPDEEIARAYACAEIACTRLQEKLRLPPTLKGRPPAPPRVYQKLLGFLQGRLDGVGGTTLGKRKAGEGTESGLATPSGTPRKTAKG